MKLLLIQTGVVALSLIGFTGCTKDVRESAIGTPKTDITQTSTEPGAYGAGSPYYVIDEKRDGRHLTVDVNVTDRGKADAVGRKVVNDKKGDATAVTVHVYASDAKPPHAPEKTIEWSADKGFGQANGGTSDR